jgi:hypothetical protein
LIENDTYFLGQENEIINDATTLELSGDRVTTRLGFRRCSKSEKLAAAQARLASRLTAAGAKLAEI